MTSSPFHHTSSLLTAPTLNHGFFTARGGVSEGIYTSLNCGPGSDDQPDAVTENRRRVSDALGGGTLLSLSQVHSADCITITEPFADDARPKADAMVTNKKGLLLGILTADCAPILLADPESGVVGAAHAGWKGAIGGVLENTVLAMEALGASRSAIRAAIGPCIQQSSYEVTEEFLAPFLEENAKNKVFFTFCERSEAIQHIETKTRLPRRPDGLLAKTIHFNLPAYLQHQAAQIGLQQIELLAIDTYPIENHCFSNRRRTHLGEPDYGRQISVIGLR